MFQRFLNLFSSRDTVIKQELKTKMPPSVADIVVAYSGTHIDEVATDFKKALNQLITDQEKLNLTQHAELSKSRIELTRTTLKDFSMLEAKGLSKQNFMEFLVDLRQKSWNVTRQYMSTPKGSELSEIGVGPLGELAEKFERELAKVAEYKSYRP